MRRLALVTALSFAALPALPAQGTFQIQRYLPTDYRNVAFFELANMRDTGVWDEMEIGVFRALMGQAEGLLGRPFASLDRITQVALARDRGPDDSGPRDQRIVIYEGNVELTEPPPTAGDEPFVAEVIGQHDVKRQQQWRDEIFVQLRPRVQLQGATALLRPMLEGTTSPGMPCADVQSLLSGRSNKSLLLFVADLADTKLNDDILAMMFEETQWPADDRPQFLMVHAAAAGAPDDPHVQVQVVFRHLQIGTGIDVTEAAVDALIQRGMATQQLRLLMPVLEGAKRTRDRSDLLITFDLGRARHVAGSLVTSVMPLLSVWIMDSATPVEEVAVPIVEAEPVAPAPVPPKSNGKKNTKKKN